MIRKLEAVSGVLRGLGARIDGRAGGGGRTWVSICVYEWQIEDM